MAKGQSSTEYLVILAVVVIIALAVVGVLGGFPTLTKGVSTKDSLAYWQSADIGVEKPYLKVAGASSFVIRNNQNFGIAFTNLTLTSSNGVVYNDTLVTLSPGQTATLSVNSTSAHPCSGASAGVSTFSPSVVISYKDASATSNTYSFSGAKPLVGTCQ
jgi:hypothetical protein